MINGCHLSQSLPYDPIMGLAAQDPAYSHLAQVTSDVNSISGTGSLITTDLEPVDSSITKQGTCEPALATLGNPKDVRSGDLTLCFQEGCCRAAETQMCPTINLCLCMPSMSRIQS